MDCHYSRRLPVLAFSTILLISADKAAGALDPPDEPEPTMKTLQEIYDRVGDVEDRVENVEGMLSELDEVRSQVADLREVVESFAIAQGLVVNGWLRTIVSTPADSGIHATLVYEPDGYPAICTEVTLGGFRRAILRKFDGQTWSTVHTQFYISQDPSMAVRPDGQRVIASRVWESLPARLEATIWNGSSWNRQVVDTFSTNAPLHTSTVYQPNGHPVISYYDPDIKSLRVARSSGSSWSTPIIDDDTDVGQYTSMAIFTDGSIVVSYYDAENTRLKMASYDSKTLLWSTEVVDEHGEVGMYSSIAIGPGGRVGISYHQDRIPGVTNNKALKYAVRIGTNWEITTVESTPQIVGKYTSLAYGPDGLPAISYYQETQGDLKYAWYDGNRWWPTFVDRQGDVGSHSSLAFNPQGKPTIAYRDVTNNNMNFAEQVPIATPP